MLRRTGILALWASQALAQDPLCESWSDPEATGALDVAVLAEASGIAASRDGSSLWVVNDGRAPVVHKLTGDGSAVGSLRIASFSPLDLEDIAIGRCAIGTCLFVADIGDNLRRRSTVQIAVLDAEAAGPEVEPLAVVTASYPDGPHDAEAIAIDPAGDLWLVTKSLLGMLAPARVYRLDATQLVAASPQTFEAHGEIPVPRLGGSGLGQWRLVTAMDIAPDGERFVLLTYDDVAIEIAVRLGPNTGWPAEWREGLTHRSIRIAPLLQTESIAYMDGGRGIVYTTESIRGSAAPLMRQTCR